MRIGIRSCVWSLVLAGAAFALPTAGAAAASQPVTLTVVKGRDRSPIVAGPVLARGAVTWAERRGSGVEVVAAASPGDVLSVGELAAPRNVRRARQTVRLFGSPRALVVNVEVDVPVRRDQREPGTLVSDDLLAAVDGQPLRSVGPHCAVAGPEQLDVDGTRLAYLSACGDDSSVLRVRDLATGETVVDVPVDMTPRAWGVRSIALAGDIVAWDVEGDVGRSSEIHALDLRTGERRVLWTGPRWGAGGWDLRADGTVAVTPTEQRQLTLVDPRGVRLPLPAQLDWYSTPRFAGDRLVASLRLPGHADEDGPVVLGLVNEGVTPIARFDGRSDEDNAPRLGGFDVDETRVAWLERQCFQDTVRVIDIAAIGEMLPSAPRRACPIARIDPRPAKLLPDGRLVVRVSCRRGCSGTLHLSIKAGPEGSGSFDLGPSPAPQRVVLRLSRYNARELRGFGSISVGGLVRSAGAERYIGTDLPLVELPR